MVEKEDQIRPYYDIDLSDDANQQFEEFVKVCLSNLPKDVVNKDDSRM